MRQKFFFSFLLLLLGLLFPLTGLRAGSFPNDAVSIYYELVGPSSHTIATSSPRTILGVSVQQSGVASDSFIYCGSSIITKNYAQNLSFNLVNFVCYNDIIISKTGQDSASFIITYVNYDITAKTPNPAPMISNIENIGYTATTSINGTQTITQATYTIPFLLFKYIVIIFFAVLIVIIISLYFFNNKKYGS